MGHAHSVYDTDSHFKVNATTRTITDISNSKTSIVQYDHDSERFTFEIPRYIEGHDMLLCNVVEVHWQNGSSRDGFAKGRYAVGDYQVSPEDDNVVICSWLISGKATQYTGVLQFQLRFSCVTETKPDYVWNTAIYSKVNVLPGLFNDNEDAEEGDDGGGGSGDGSGDDEGGGTTTKKLDAPVITLETEEDNVATTAVLGVAVLGEMKLGDNTDATVLAAPKIELVSIVTQLAAPVIMLEAEAMTQLATPEIELVEG